MIDFRRHFILTGSPIKLALEKLNQLASDAILFVVDEGDKLLGSLTDGDVRRGFLAGRSMDSITDDFIQPAPKFLVKGDYKIEEVIELRRKKFRIIPVVDKQNKVINVINFGHFRSYLPLDAIIMAGGRGSRLRPLTDELPKPLLKIGDKPIIEHNMDRLIKFGVDDFWLSVRYLGEKLEDYFGDGTEKQVNIQYVWEDEPLGTIGAVSLIDSLEHDHILLTNSDLLTNVDYEDFYLDFLQSGAQLSVVTIPYSVNIPYAVMETEGKRVTSFKEKPTYTYYSNGGIYLFKREVLDLIPHNSFFNTTDLMEKIIEQGGGVNSYPLRGYWLDIGKPEDFKKAQEDINHIKF